MMRLLITGAAGINEYLLTELRHQGWDIDILQCETEPVIYPAKYDAVICNGLFLYSKLEEFTRLKLIQLTSAGLDRVPVDAIKERGIKLFNARGVYSIPMAEWVVANILSEYKNLFGFRQNQRARIWHKNRCLQELTQKNIAVIGAGSVGSEVAKRLKPFGVNIDGYDLNIFSSDVFERIRLISDFDISSYDIVVLTAPYTSNTRKMINRELLSRMRPNAMLINVSRGGLIDEKALVDVFSSRQDLTAVLDVFDVEPLQMESPLWQMENIRISPHNSFVGEYNTTRLHKLIISNLKDFITNSEKL